MKNHTLTLKQNIFIGSMLFGLFFGAGNLIFPIHLGQTAGANVWLANLGFNYSDWFTIFRHYCNRSIKTNGVFEIASRVSTSYAYIFTIGLYLVIGPFFALPRLATTSFEIAFLHLFHQVLQRYYYQYLVLYSLF